jgi:phage baseplate assembly protein W
VITTPQLDAPFRLNADGTPATVQQNSIADVAACVYNILACPTGAKLGDPTFGTPSLLFQTVPVNTAAMVTAIQRLEPRATVEIVADTLGATQDVTVNVASVSPQAS